MSALQHTCLARATNACLGAVKPRTRKGTKVCPGCASPVLTERGLYAVVAHRGDGRYDLDDAEATRVTKKAAERVRETFGDTHVVRFLPL